MPILWAGWRFAALEVSESPGRCTHNWLISCCLYEELLRVLSCSVASGQRLGSRSPIKGGSLLRGRRLGSRSPIKGGSSWGKGHNLPPPFLFSICPRETASPPLWRMDPIEGPVSAPVACFDAGEDDSRFDVMRIKYHMRATMHGPLLNARAHVQRG